MLEPDESTDGDSFRVRLPGDRLETFRLYFVDTTEPRSRGKRSNEQAADFGLMRAQAIDLGREAKIFTASAFVQPFTTYTRWRRALGRSANWRYYAIVVTADSHDLNELLVTNGLARLHSGGISLVQNVNFAAFSQGEVSGSHCRRTRKGTINSPPLGR